MSVIKKEPSPNNPVDQVLRELGLPIEDIPVEEVKALEPPKEKLKRGPCGKVQYPSEGAVNLSIDHLLKTKKANTSKLRSYFCDICKAHHMSSTFFGKTNKQNGKKENKKG